MSCVYFSIRKTNVPSFGTSQAIELKEDYCNLRKRDQNISLELYSIFFPKGLQGSLVTPTCPFSGNKNEICPKFKE